MIWFFALWALECLRKLAIMSADYYYGERTKDAWQTIHIYTMLLVCLTGLIISEPI